MSSVLLIIAITTPVNVLRGISMPRIFAVRNDCSGYVSVVQSIVYIPVLGMIGTKRMVYPDIYCFFDNMITHFAANAKACRQSPVLPEALLLKRRAWEGS